ncbi:unnamed protein product, partial [Ectocarpus sp. 12 AP-2014]
GREIAGLFCQDYTDYVENTCTDAREYICYDEFFDTFGNDEDVDTFFDGCDMECSKYDYTHYT